jgi:hypothetical protein
MSRRRVAKSQTFTAVLAALKKFPVPKLEYYATGV